jgi:hypothetical protein
MGEWSLKSLDHGYRGWGFGIKLEVADQLEFLNEKLDVQCVELEPNLFEADRYPDLGRRPSPRALACALLLLSQFSQVRQETKGSPRWRAYSVHGKTS